MKKEEDQEQSHEGLLIEETKDMIKLKKNSKVTIENYTLIFLIELPNWHI